MRSSNCLRVIGALLSRMRLQAEPPGGGEAGQVHEAVPAHGERADGERDRVDVGVNEHGASARCGGRAPRSRAPRRASAPRGHASHRSSRGCRSASSRYTTPRRPRLAIEAGHDRYAQAARYQAHYRLHLDRLLRDVERDAGPRGQPARRYRTSPGRSRAAPSRKARRRARSPRACRRLAGEAVPGREARRRSARAAPRGARGRASPVTGGSSSPKSSSPARERRRLLGREHFAQRERHARPGGLEALQQSRQHAVVGERDEADAQPALLARRPCRAARAPCVRAGRCMRRASSSKRAPSAVSSTRRRLRANSATPRRSSSARMARDSGGCEMCSASAARPKCSRSATAMKYRICHEFPGDSYL